MALHFLILYVPFLSVSIEPESQCLYRHLTDLECLLLSQSLFQITPLNWQEWKAVLWISAPVILIDEVLKYITLLRGEKRNHPYGQRQHALTNPTLYLSRTRFKGKARVKDYPTTP
jgi:hypothetical protein